MISDKDATAAAAPLAPIVNSGIIQSAKFLSDAAQMGNFSSVVWANAFNTTVTLTGAATQCVELKYSGEVAVSSDFLPLSVQFRAVVDNTVANGGAPFFDAIDSEIFSLTGMTWWRCGLAPGVHTVRIQFRPRFAGDAAFVRNRTLVIGFAQ